MKKSLFCNICFGALTAVLVASFAAGAWAQNDDNGAIKKLMSPAEYKAYAASKAYADQNSSYTLGPTDVVTITVQRHPEVSGDYTINTEGKIQYEFVGDVVIAGLTKKQAVALLVKKLSTYIIHPEVTMKITGYNSKVVYVIGEVGMPGRIPMHGDTITVRQALLDAGLPLLSAATKGARLFTPSDSGRVVMKRVNVYALLYEGDLRQNFVMKSGDTLYVPATMLAKAMRVISPVTQPVENVAGTAGAARYGAGM
ncbi:MAG: polysaccharide biosynthesis/export family protein [Candidatus Omnitrophica bacterium]|nr:polysaccharide biosynthesis/export family protein [Candidatus Omnitrophota bacterium]MDE2009677.1 polysaccharide biosynthesis/export family protein [Candidatus Omnitrophota bacterium]MDE2214395.1 polysaccharide biosynthesis/export family protein [Candidatus Omnitrophota bacterium]MDE2231535.1 polysaccharide biosynthesis/export family protein [Candidatus Omnitrophota bacterium]